MDFPFKIIHLIFLCIVCNYSACASLSADNPCTGPNNLLALIDRPTVALSACTINKNSLLIETGYQYLKLNDLGNQQNFPEAEIRVGITNDLEFELFAPNYIYQTIQPHSGFTTAAIGLKKVLASDTKWIASVSAIAILPAGSSSFGSEQTGGIINGIISYNLPAYFNLSFMLGAGSLPLSKEEGGQSYTSINPDLVFSWQKYNYSLYGELYGQSKTRPEEGSGYNYEFGLIILVKNNLALDFAVGQRLNGTLYNLNQFIGAGLSAQFL